MDEDLRQRVAQKIIDAFSATPYPGDNNIGGDDPFDGVSVEEAFRGKHWRNISLKLLLLHHDKLPFFSPQGFRFYLPAYLLGVLFHFEDLDGYFVPSRIINVLTPPHQYPHMFLGTAKQFSTQEKDAIHSFLYHFKALFPDESWSYLPSEGQNLDEAIEFWEDQTLRSE
jgi:hypothetical protein